MFAFSTYFLTKNSTWHRVCITKHFIDEPFDNSRNYIAPVYYSYSL